MYRNVPARFLPDGHLDPIYAHPDIDYGRNTSTLNAAYELVEKGIQSNDWGDEIAIRDLNTDAVLTYDDLLTSIETFANCLRKLSVQPGDRVFMRLGDRPETIIVQLATWKVGAVVVPSVIQERARELEYFINDVEPSIIVTEDRELHELEQVLPDCPTVEDVILVGADAEEYHSYEGLLEGSEPFTEYVETDPTDVATIYYSGGTTPGHSTGNIASHATEVVWADVEGGLCKGFDTADVNFEAAPMGHARGNLLKRMPFRFGAQSLLIHRPAPGDIWGILDDYDVTVFTMVPTLGRMMLKEGAPEAIDLTSIRLLAFSGERLDENTYDRWNDLIEPEPCNAVGGTPFGTFLVSYRHGEKYLPGQAVKPSIGYDVKIVDLDDPSKEVDRNEIGQLAIKGPVDAAYWNNPHPDMPEEMAEDLLDGNWYVYDDAYSRDEKGYIRFESRVDDLIQSGGRNISAIEVEDVLMDHDLVEEVAVVGAPDDVRGNIVKAFIIPRTDSTPGDLEKTHLQEFAKEKMAPFKYPREIEFVDELPKNKAGKLKRADLKTNRS